MELHQKYVFLFCFGGIAYMIVEMMWRGKTDWTMGILGGLCFICCGLLNQIFSWEMLLGEQMLISSIIITILELFAGLILNVWLKLNIWDYSKMSFNIMGQICLTYSILWFFLSAVAIVVDDYLRYWFFGEDKPHYYLFRKNTN